jgi:hypothetical protein
MAIFLSVMQMFISPSHIYYNMKAAYSLTLCPSTSNYIYTNKKFDEKLLMDPGKVIGSTYNKSQVELAWISVIIMLIASTGRTRNSNRLQYFTDVKCPFLTPRESQPLP